MWGENKRLQVGCLVWKVPKSSFDKYPSEFFSQVAHANAPTTRIVKLLVTEEEARSHESATKDMMLIAGT